MTIKAGQTVLSVTGNRMFRMNKDGTLDQRYALGRRYARYDADRGVISKKIKRQATKRRAKREGASLIEKILGALTVFGMIVLLVMGTDEGNKEATLFGEVSKINSKDFDASLYKTAHATEKSSVESNVEGKKAYLENPVTLEEKKDYIRFKFGENYQVACMVAYGESLRGNGVNSSPVERSSGVFQINLADNYGYGNKIHWNKVPGDTLEEKEAWLLNPKNNIDLAYEMSNGGTSWGQWEAWNRKTYLAFEEECR